MAIRALPTGEIRRDAYVCDASAPLCPRCRMPLVGRSTLTPTGSLTTCFNRFRRPGESASRTCGAKVFTVAIVGGLVKVIEVNDEEALAITAGNLTLRELLVRLGLLVTRSA